MKHPTPGQLRLLQSIADGNVVSDVGDERVWEVGYIVTKSVRGMQRNGWCEPIARGDVEDWKVTDAGRAFLPQHAEEAAL